MTSNDWWISNEISLKKIQNCKISWKIFLKTRKWKNRMYGQHKHIFSTCSEGFRPIHSTASSATGTQTYQNNNISLLLGHDNPRMDTICSKTMILVSSKLEKTWNEWFSRVPSTPTTKNYAGNEVLRPKIIPRKKTFFLQKMFFRNIFHFFRHLNISIFAILPIWGCVRT